MKKEKQETPVVEEKVVTTPAATTEQKMQQTQQKMRKNLEYMRDRDRELVRGVFHYYEVPGGMHKFDYRGHKGDAIEKYTLFDGEVATIPLGVARHLNEAPRYPVYEYMPSDGNSYGTQTEVKGVGLNRRLMRITSYRKRMGFESLEFRDIEGMENKKLVKVEYV